MCKVYQKILKKVHGKQYYEKMYTKKRLLLWLTALDHIIVPQTNGLHCKRSLHTSRVASKMDINLSHRFHSNGQYKGGNCGGQLHDGLITRTRDGGWYEWDMTTQCHVQIEMQKPSTCVGSRQKRCSPRCSTRAWTRSEQVLIIDGALRWQMTTIELWVIVFFYGGATRVVLVCLIARLNEEQTW